MNLDQLNIKDQRVLLRVDFNVPLNKEYKITDDTRMQAALPTINKILSQGARLIIMSHLGRPQKKKLDDGSIDKKKFTLAHVQNHLAKLTNTKVHFCDTPYGENAISQSIDLNPGEILLLENTRFFEQEAKGDLEFASRLSALGDIYINDAFGTAHRAHASTTTVAKFFPSHRKSFGLLIASEISSADNLMNSPKRPMTAIIGGAKVSDKILLLERLIEKVNIVIVGGAMAYTFIKAQGGKVGTSLVEDDYLDVAKSIIKKAKENQVDLLFPVDSLCSTAFDNDIPAQKHLSYDIPEDQMGLDIGSQAIEDFKVVIKQSKSILWNGPLGVFEMSQYAKGTFAIAEAVAKATQENDAFSLIGGGDSVAAINKSGLSNQVSHISTGGGAMLEYLEGKTLPGIQAILD